MNASGSRITDPDNPPCDSAVADWLGKEAYKYWKQVMDLIGQYYPNTFTPEWLFGGKKHGWSLRYKKSKSFCSLIPEQHRFLLLIVFGKEDRAKVEAVRESLSQDTQKQYDEATTYHDGKWVVLNINTDKVVADVMQLLGTKRKAKN